MIFNYSGLIKTINARVKRHERTVNNCTFFNNAKEERRKK